jgi:hypothetical protein
MPASLGGEDAARLQEAQDAPTLIPKVKAADVEGSQAWAITAPLTYARALRSRSGGTTLYELIEPTRLRLEEEVLREVTGPAADGGWARGAPTTPAEGAGHVQRSMEGFLVERGRFVPRATRTRVAYYLWRESAGLGRIDALTRDTELTLIACSTAGAPVRVGHRSLGPLDTNVVFPTAQSLESLAARAARALDLRQWVADRKAPGPLALRRP